MPSRFAPLHTCCAAIITLAGTAAHAEDVLLITDATADRVMAFSPVDGSVVNLNLVTDPGVVGGVDIFNRPLNAIDSGRGTILVSDQFANLVAEFTYDNQYLGIFSNSGVVDTNVLSNIRGIDISASGDLLVTSGGGTIGVNARTVMRFDTNGATQSPFAFSRYGGIRGPFDVLVLKDRVLVADEGSDFIAQYTPEGKFTGLFARGLDFPQQMSQTATGNILVAVFSGGYIAEFNAAGTLVGQYDPGTLSSYRGVIELDNGNLLTTTGTGVQEVTRFGIVVNTRFTGTETRYIERVTLPEGVTLAALRERGAQAPPTPPSPPGPPPTETSERGDSAMSVDLDSQNSDGGER